MGAPGAQRLQILTDTGERRIISTGSVEIDKKMGGGIPEGSLIMIEGQSNAGKSVVTQQLINGALNSGFRAVLYTTENTPQSLFRQMASLDLDVTDFFLLGALNVLPRAGGDGPGDGDDGLRRDAAPPQRSRGTI
jgi:archaellum biogenesis ATPase FlaH